MGKKAKELPRIMSLGSKPPTLRDDEIPHWKVWRWAIKHPGVPWRRECGAPYSDVFGKTCRCSLRRGHEGHHVDIKRIAETQRRYGI